MSTTPPTIESRDYYTVITHFYRGELGRMMEWRQRLDITTNWAIVGSTGMITFALSSPDNTHLTFLVANLLAFLLLIIEARRYRYYDAFRARVRMLEAHFILPVLMKDAKILQGDWNEVLAEDLVTPSFKISYLEAITRRFRRNYMWIIGIIQIAWFLKIWIHYPESRTLPGFLMILTGDDPLQTIVLSAMIAGFYGFVIFLLFRALFIESRSGEFVRTAMRREKWLK